MYESKKTVKFQMIFSHPKKLNCVFCLKLYCY